MEKDFEEFVVNRCSSALVTNQEYMDMEYSQSVSQDELQAKAEKLCYLQGYKDALENTYKH